MREQHLSWIAEPRFLCRLREIWSAFLFLVRGGKYKVHLDFGDLDPRILAGPTLYIWKDGQVIDIERERNNSLVSCGRQLQRQSSLILAAEGDPDAFLVRWNRLAKKDAWAKRLSVDPETVSIDLDQIGGRGQP